ncbi:MAG: nuclease [Microbacteriaceae bacterium]|nr:nuclease [Microbacteriaceae bacterium]
MNEIDASVQLEGHFGMCADGCSSTRAGHRVLVVQEVVAAASPSAFRDAIVVAVDAGRLDLVEIATGSALRLWHHSPVALAVGEPVAYHPVAGLLAAGRVRLSVR